MQSSIRIALFYVAILLKGSINVLQQYEAKGHPLNVSKIQLILECIMIYAFLL